MFLPFCGGHTNSGGLCVVVEQSAGCTGAMVGSERTRKSDLPSPQGAAAREASGVSSSAARQALIRTYRMPLF